MAPTLSNLYFAVPEAAWEADSGTGLELAPMTDEEAHTRARNMAKRHKAPYLVVQGKVTAVYGRKLAG